MMFVAVGHEVIPLLILQGRYEKALDDSASSQQLWTTAADIIDRTFVHPIPSRELNTLGNTFGQAQDQCLQAMGYLGSTLQRDCCLSDALNTNGTILPWASRKYPTSLKTYRLIVLPFFTSYWEGAFGRKRVLFGAPGMVKEALTQALTEPEGKRVQAVLKAVSLGLDGDAGILRSL